VPSALAPALPRGVYLSKPNVRELGEMLGEEIEGRAEIVEASRRLIAETGTSIIVTSIAAGGAVVVGEGLEEQIPAPTVRVKSKVGAGDSMVGGMVLGLQRGMSLREAVRFGVATGSAAVMSARTGLEKREDAERLYERMREQQGQ
jgi:6-phosphofructokinase 2